MQIKDKGNLYVENEQVPFENIDSGISRKVMAFDDQLMMAKVFFESGSVGVLHQHIHSQISHIESGLFEVQIGEIKKVLKAGDAFYIPPNSLHGVVCLEKGVLIDVFSPMREDFVI
jgi:quercetin dioxygenase-like cupin family protein